MPWVPTCLGPVYAALCVHWLGLLYIVLFGRTIINCWMYSLTSSSQQSTGTCVLSVCICMLKCPLLLLYECVREVGSSKYCLFHTSHNLYCVICIVEYREVYSWCIRPEVNILLRSDITMPFSPKIYVTYIRLPHNAMVAQSPYDIFSYCMVTRLP